MNRSVSPRLWLVPVRPLVWLLLVTHLAVAVGAPIPAIGLISSGERFPCESHGCGCATAQRCWQQCCCYTTAQKLAWARANNVQPPDELEADAPQPTKTQSARRACCSTSQQPATCEPTPRKPSACEAPAEEVDATPETEFTWQLALQAQRCRGQAGTWLHAEPSLLPPTIEISTIEAPCVERLVLFPESVASRAIVPPVPPPRLAAQPLQLAV